VKLTVRRGGGIAGIVARTELDAAALPRQDADEFAAKIDQAGLKNLEDPRSTRRMPDAMLYDISWEESGQQRSLHFTEESLPEGVRQLLGWVEGRSERVESIEL
jgi:hypothetical protein